MLLHGGRADGLAPPTWLNLPDRRLRLFGTALLRQLGDQDTLLACVRYRHRGWNGHHAHPAQDARDALVELADLVPAIPVILVGHSMGGRAALAVAGHPAVRGVIALAPWCPPGEAVAHLRGKTLAFLHDETDRVTSAHQTWDFADRAAASGAHIHTVPMRHGGHTMLHGARRWHRLTADFATAILDPDWRAPWSTLAQLSLRTGGA
ncbi:alpha/beta hydrolase [Streptomyces rubellomurinus]|uniref:alpha/beta hydrolase n=1 Tax=Streptomyces rubellomurinus (strain ATCC 31215) TaxID=359131 RepID=UPI003133B82F